MSNKQPLLSIIIAVYNTGGEQAGKVLYNCLDSILIQKFNSELLEIVCVNDGSTDDSLSTLKNYANKYKNIVLVDQKNTGVGGAKNSGINNASGKYLWFINSDDCIKNGSIDCILRMLNDFMPDIIRVKIKNISEDIFDFKKVIKLKKFSYQQLHNFIEPPSDDVTSIIRSDIINDNNIRFLPNTVYHSDRLLFVQYFLNINSDRRFLINETVYLRRQRAISETGKVSFSIKAKNQYVKDSIIMAEEYKKILDNNNIIDLNLKNFIQSQQYFFTEVAIVSIPSSSFNKKNVVKHLKFIGVYPYPFLWQNLKNADGFLNFIIVLIKCFLKFNIIYNVYYLLQVIRNKITKKIK